MDKTIKINLGGTLFQIDEEAYKILRRYLQDIDNRLKNTPGGAETIEDIESRIAEIFQSQSGTAGVISRENVEAMISVVGKPEDFDTESGSGSTNENKAYYHSVPGKKMYRNPDDTIISGVCGGIGIYLNIDPVWVRLLFILFACFGGVGFLVYVALWIALPSATTDSRKREMYGRDDYATFFRKRGTGYSQAGSSQGNIAQGYEVSGIGNVFNEIFRAVGKVCFIIVRIFLIAIGVIFTLTGFFMLASFVMVFFFKYPDYFSTHSLGVNLFYLPDFLNYIVSPAIAPWILVLTFIVILLPLLALIYWGVKMIFWFKAKDGIFSIIGLVIWVMCIAALSILLFNEGISFSETAKTVSEEVIENAPKDLYIFSDNKISGLQYDKEISFYEEDYNVFFSNDNKGLFISSGFIIDNSDNNTLKINVRKRSSGRSRSDGARKAESLIYHYRFSGDTLLLDEYFSIPQGNKWSADNVTVNLYIPEGTVIHFDKTAENMFLRHHYYDDEWVTSSDTDADENIRSGNGKYSWVMTENGPRKQYDKAEK